MTCLVHDSHYRSLFHGVVNELRNEKRVPMQMLRSMPQQCCTCKDIDTLTLISVLIHDKETLNKLRNLIDQVEKNKQTNPKLVLALNRLENFIKTNRGPVPLTISTTDVDRSKTRTFSSSSEDDTPKIIRKRSLQKQKKPSKPLKTGTFLFLSYNFPDKPVSDELLEAAKKLQRGRFFGRNKNIESLEEEHHVHINMITSTTSEQIQKTLNNAKAGVGNVKIHNQEDVSDDGEWILVREKKKKVGTNAPDLEAALNEIKNRWEGFLKTRKRKSEDDDEKMSSRDGFFKGRKLKSEEDDDDDDDEKPSKK